MDVAKVALLHAQEIPLQARRVGHAAKLLATFQVVLGLRVAAEPAGRTTGQKPGGGIPRLLFKVPIKMRGG
ncbi:MAG: hypothetical protein L0Y70_28235 [Gemmataceae bacterium]|nr:hypothetical protein [Gemmataceae bacterium]